MFPRNAVTCKRCFKVFCCKLHRKVHEGRCCAQLLTRTAPMKNPAVERKVDARLLVEAKDRKPVCSNQHLKRKFCLADSPNFFRPDVRQISFDNRKILVPVRQRLRTLPAPSLPLLIEENEIIEENPPRFTAIHENAKTSNTANAYINFTSSAASPIGFSASPLVGSESTPLPAYEDVMLGDAAATPLTQLVQRSEHHNGAVQAGAFKTSTPKDDEPTQDKNEQAADAKESNIPGNALPVNNEIPLIPYTPMTLEVRRSPRIKASLLAGVLKRQESYNIKSDSHKKGAVGHVSMTSSHSGGQDFPLEPSPINAEPTAQQLKVPVNRNLETFKMNNESAIIPAKFMTCEAQGPTSHESAMLARISETSTPINSDGKPDSDLDELPADEQVSTIPPTHSDKAGGHEYRSEESLNMEPAVEHTDTLANYNKETFVVNRETISIPVTPMMCEKSSLGRYNLMEGLDARSKRQPTPSTSQVLVDGSSSSFATPFLGKKKKVSWSSDTYEPTTPYLSARSHFSPDLTPVTPLPNPSVFTSVKDAFKNLVCRMPGTSDEQSPAKKRLKRLVESKIKCRPTYKGRYPRSRSYLIFNKE